MKPLFLALPLALASSMAVAETPQLAVGTNIGLMGAGLDLTMKFSDQVNARGAVRFGSIDADGEEDGIEYKGSLDLSSVGVLVDYHPMRGSFRLTAGMFSNSNELDLTATSPDNAEIGDVTYDIDDGRIDSNVSFPSTAPYLGIGWGNPVGDGSRWTFTADVGVLFQGSPEADVQAQGTASVVGGPPTASFTIGDGSVLDAQFQAELDEERENLNDDLDDFDMLPVISLGLAYRF